MAEIGEIVCVYRGGDDKLREQQSIKKAVQYVRLIATGEGIEPYHS